MNSNNNNDLSTQRLNHLTRSVLTVSCFFLYSFFFVVFIGNAQADSQWIENIGDMRDGWKETAEKGVEGPLIGWHYYWKDGFHSDSTKKNLKFKLNGRIILDGGYIGADNELNRAFPDLEGWNIQLRDLRVSMFGTLYDWMEFKFSVDFANVRDIKDEWIRFTKIPCIGPITLGYMKESFSLEELTGLKNITFMERALPTEVFAPRRNFGISHQTTLLNQQMTWALGVFLNTGSFSNVGDSTDQISDPNGWDLTTRVTGLPWYEDNGKELLHLGLSYAHQFRDIKDTGAQLRTRPESRLTNVRLVDTGEFSTKGMDRINTELAIVSGPLSFQGEYFHLFADSDEVGDPRFWGFYLYGSYFITGEHRNYDRSNGVFSRITPNSDFHFFEGGWGALEVALRLSYIDLNGGSIRGGREYDLTTGLNWYLNEKTRFMLNYVRAKAKDREIPPPVEGGTADIFQLRFQIMF